MAAHPEPGSGGGFSHFREFHAGVHEDLTASEQRYIGIRSGIWPSSRRRNGAKHRRIKARSPTEQRAALAHLKQGAGWSSEETATHLALALGGPALQVLADLLPDDRRELRAITAALKWRFGQRTSAEQSIEQLAGCYRQDGESLGAFAADMQLYTQLGYPICPAAAREELSLHYSLRGLAPERLRQDVCLATLQSLHEALKEAERVEEVLGAGSAPGRLLSWHRPFRAASWEAAGDCLEGEGTSRAQQAVTR
ncbi:hypothetical protein Q8A73_006520 [Channa argus]|nr:hypothetical protein Q8A73_006520 [Channa argus]